jgi:hypothetical protein
MFPISTTKSYKSVMDSRPGHLGIPSFHSTPRLWTPNRLSHRFPLLLDVRVVLQKSEFHDTLKSRCLKTHRTGARRGDIGFSCYSVDQSSTGILLQLELVPLLVTTPRVSLDRFPHDSYSSFLVFLGAVSSTA